MTRDDLAKQQDQLVQALVAGGPTPEGFDVDAVQATAEALLRKRAGEIASRDPHLKFELGTGFEDHFRAWARARPKTTTTADAAAFREHLVQHGIIKAAPQQSRWWRRRRRTT